MVRSTFRIRPVFLALASVALGILTADMLPGVATVASILALVAFAACLPLVFRGDRDNGHWLAILALTLFFTGMGRAAMVSAPGPRDAAHWIGRPSLLVGGRIVSDVEENGRGSVTFTFAATLINDYERIYPANGRIRVTLPGLSPAERPAIGDGLWLRGRLMEPQPATNPGAFDYAAYLKRRGVFTILTVRGPDDLRRTGKGDGSPWERAVTGIRGFILRATAAHLKRDDAALLNGLLLSVRTNLPADLTDAFARTGTVHILSVSGLHLTTLAVFLTWAFGLLSAPRPLANLCSILLLWLFALASGGSPAAVRSAVMATLVLAAPLVRRRPEPLHSLATAGVGILLVEPGAVYDAGFQLSFAATGTLLLWGPPLYRVWLRPEPGMDRGQILARNVLAGLLVGLLAELGSGPLVAFHFNRITVIGAAANLPIGLLTEGLLLGGLTLSALSWLPGLLAAPFWWLLGGGLWLLRFLVFGFAVFPWASFSVASPPVAALFVYYLLLGGLGFAFRQWALQKTLFVPPLVDAPVASVPASPADGMPEAAPE